MQLTPAGGRESARRNHLHYLGRNLLEAVAWAYAAWRVPPLPYFPPFFSLVLSAGVALGWTCEKGHGLNVLLLRPHLAGRL